MNEILKINPKFEQIIPPLSAEEFAQLEENILKVGRVLEPIQVWRGFIVDGHHRYKIVQKHPEITYKIEELKYECEGEVFAWICNLQLGRRNITENQKRYLVGKRYDSELVILDFYGNQHTLPKKSGLGTSCPDQKGHGTRTIIAEQNGVSDGYVNKAYQYMKGVNAAEEVCPGIKDEILTGVIETSIPEIVGLEKIPLVERKTAVECLRTPKEKRKAKEIARQIEEAFANGTEQETEEEIPQEKEVAAPIPESAPKPKPTETDEKVSETKEHEIEESILNSMIGAVNMFIDSINNYLSRFPRLRTDPKYRSQTREIMVAAREYINDVEGDLL